MDTPTISAISSNSLRHNAGKSFFMIRFKIPARSNVLQISMQVHGEKYL